MLERAVFNNRKTVMVLCALITLVLAALAVTRLSLSASFEKMIPSGHPYIKNYLDNRAELRGLGNALRIVVESRNGDIFDPKYETTLKKIHDEVFLTPGVDRAWVKSLWAPGVRWTEVTEEGFQGGPVMPDNYDGSSKATEQLRDNIARSGIVGSLVGNDFKSSMLVVPLLDIDPSGQRLDYRALSRQLDDIRVRYETDAQGHTSRWLRGDPGAGRRRLHLVHLGRVSPSCSAVWRYAPIRSRASAGRSGAAPGVQASAGAGASGAADRVSASS